MEWNWGRLAKPGSRGVFVQRALVGRSATQCVNPTDGKGMLRYAQVFDPPKAKKVGIADRPEESHAAGTREP